MFPKISVITPSYNQAQFLEETIISVIGQQYLNLEYLIIDGGSNDGSVDIIKKYQDKITYWISEKDSGQADAINKGFQKATGEIICWLNSDDLLIPGSLLKVARYFDHSKEPQLLIGNAFTFKQNTGGGAASDIRFAHAQYDLRKYDYIIQPSTFWNKMVLEKVGRLNEELHFMLDWEWFIKIQQAGIKIHQVNDYFSLYRIHENHKSSSKSDRRIEEIFQVLKDHTSEDYVAFAKKLYLDKNVILKWNKLFGYPLTNIINALLLKILFPKIFLSRNRHYAFRLIEMF